MGRLGFEPRTSRLKAEYSTVELATQGVRQSLANPGNHSSAAIAVCQTFWRGFLADFLRIARLTAGLGFRALFNLFVFDL